jgi:hypothetical protein
MTPPRTGILPVTVAALIFGNFSADLALTGDSSPLPNDLIRLIAGETQVTQGSDVQSQENAEESAKMGKDAGTHTGDKAAMQENDTNKVDQPPSQNKTTGE